MKRTSRRTWVSALALGTAALSLGGCVTDPASRGYRVSEKFSDEAAAIDDLRDQMDTTLTALQELLKAQVEDLKPVFRSFRRETRHLANGVAALDPASSSVNRWGEDYLTRPGKPGDIAATATEAQKTEFRRSLAQATAGYRQLSSRFGPLLSSLRHVESVLKTGLTVENLESVRGAGSLAPTQAQPIPPLLAKLAADLRALGTRTADQTGPGK